jgi:hypothetical protein
MTMSFKNKLLAMVGTTALAAGAALVAATPALAVVPTTPAQGVRVGFRVIANGDEQYVNFNADAGAWLNAPGRYRSYCLFVGGLRPTPNTGTSLSTAFNETNGDLSGDYQETVSAGTISPVLNKNQTTQDLLYEWIGIDWASTGLDCASLSSTKASLSTDSNVDSFTLAKSWTVTPAIESPISQTLSIGTNNHATVAAVGHAVDPVLDLSVGSHWRQTDLQNCDPTQTANPQTVDLATLGLTLDETGITTAGAIAPVSITGTPLTGTSGTYHLCLQLTGDNGRHLPAMFNLTITDAPQVSTPAPSDQPALAVTGVDSQLAMGSGIAGSALLLLGIGAIVLAFRRRSSRK